MEHLNKIYKDSSKASLGQLTENTIQRHSQLAGLSEGFRKIYKEAILLQEFKGVRKTGRVDRTQDTNHLVKSLIRNKVFQIIPGRKCEGFNDIQHSAKVKNPKKFKKKLLEIVGDVADDTELGTF